MPTVAPGSRVLVTGANGYIAMWVVRHLLEQGYTVRGVIRSQDKGKRLKEYFASYGDKLELAIVPDMMKARFLRFRISQYQLTYLFHARMVHSTTPSRVWMPSSIWLHL